MESMQKAAKEKSSWLWFIALAMLTCAPSYASSAGVSHPENRVEIFLLEGQNGVGQQAFRTAKHVENYDSPWGVALDSSVAPKGVVTRFVTGADGKIADLGPTLDRIKNGVKFPHRNDGTIFKNREGLLPSKPAGYWTEHVHPTPGGKGPGLQRIVIGQNGEIYFTPDHYKTFIPLNPSGGAW